jgi:hypothetical protein
VRIVAASITPAPNVPLDPIPELHETLEDGGERTLFWYYPDERSFTAQEFVGLTEAEALELKHRRDVAFLTS